MRIPKHIGIIPDGNRRWAVSQGMGKKDGYDHGLEPGLLLLKAAEKYGIEELTYYGFTVDNCKRPTEQIQAFAEACVKAVELIAAENVALKVVGNTDSAFFPKELMKYGKERIITCSDSHKEKETQKSPIKVNFLVNYGWQWDLKNGFQSKDISRVDMIIRWGGMRRLSGFLPLQSVYADFFVVDTLWPDYRDEDFDKAITWYQNQDVTLGG